MPAKKDTKHKLSWFKKRAWDNFSKYIRARDALKTTGDLDYCLCITCGRKTPTFGIGCIQAGHFIASRVNSILFDERNCHAQCYSCNVGHGGAYVEYFIKMEELYGREVIDELRALKNQTVTYKWFDYERIAKEYEEKLLQIRA